MVSKQIVFVCAAALLVQLQAAQGTAATAYLSLDDGLPPSPGRCKGLMFQAIGMINALRWQMEAARGLQADTQAGQAACKEAATAEEAAACEEKVLAKEWARGVSLLAGQARTSAAGRYLLPSLAACKSQAFW